MNLFCPTECDTLNHVVKAAAAAADLPANFTPRTGNTCFQSTTKIFLIDFHKVVRLT